jgi:hypothetical protein
MWWRVYYDDGSCFTSQEGTPFDAPRRGVQIIVQEKDGGHELVWGRDHFYFEPKSGGWCTSDLFGALDHLMRAERQCLLFGRWLNDDEFRELHRRVREDVGTREYRFAREADREAGR